MNQLDDDEALILAQARNGLGPTSSDERRLLHNVLVQVAMTPVATVEPSANGVPKSPWPLRIAGSVAVIGAVALSGGLGYHQGFQAGIAQKNSHDTRENAVVSAALPMVDEAKPAPAPSMEPAHPVEHAPQIERRWEREAKSNSVSSAARIPSASPAPSSRLGLDEEVRQLRRVERAIREGNPRLALVLLEEVDQSMPAGQLLEERRAASIMANCQLGSADAVSNARAFAAKHSGSAYLTRVIAICGLEGEWKSAVPGTNTPRSGG